MYSLAAGLIAKGVEPRSRSGPGLAVLLADFIFFRSIAGIETVSLVPKASITESWGLDMLSTPGNASGLGVALCWCLFWRRRLAGSRMLLLPSESLGARFVSHLRICRSYRSRQVFDWGFGSQFRNPIVEGGLVLSIISTRAALVQTVGACMYSGVW